MACITPPFQAPDEPAHFLRIWQLSHGQFVSDHYGGLVPISLCNCYARFLPLENHPERKANVAAILDEFHRPLHPARQQRVLFANTAIYSIVPYLPQVPAIFVGRQFALPPIALMYLGRCANVLGYALLGSLAIRITPILKWAATFVLLAPLPLFLAGSLSADPMTTSLAFLTTASVLRLMTNAQPMPWHLVATFALASVGLALCKWAYLPVVAFVFAVRRPAWGNIKRPHLLQACIVACAVAATAMWAGLSHPGNLRELNGDPPVQLQWILAHPFGYFHVLFKTVCTEYKTIGWTTIGVLGWLDTRLSPWFIGPYMLLACWAAVADRGVMPLPWTSRMVAASGVLASSVIVATCVYLVCNRPGSPSIEGIQGRYLVPLALLGFVVIRRGGRPSMPVLLMGLVITASCVYAVVAVACRYYQPHFVGSPPSAYSPSILGRVD
jgi:uncharacterized membrane protein